MFARPMGKIISFIFLLIQELSHTFLCQYSCEKLVFPLKRKEGSGILCHGLHHGFLNFNLNKCAL